MKKLLPLILIAFVYAGCGKCHTCHIAFDDPHGKYGAPNCCDSSFCGPNSYEVNYTSAGTAHLQIHQDNNNGKKNYWYAIDRDTTHFSDKDLPDFDTVLILNKHWRCN